MYNAVLVSDVQHNDSCVCVCMNIYILFQILFPYRLLQNIEILSIVPCAIQ